MKPVSLEFQCFGPYMERQRVDFERLERSGLFLICGETGAGKSTILDAICYALYGKSSGGLRGDIEVMRCKLAGREDVTSVEFTFDCGGERYRFARSLQMSRKIMHSVFACQILKDGVFVPIQENAKATFMNQKAQEIIGLTYEQFRQVIILPQGQFEKLLVSDSTEKEKILVSLFGADRWQRIAEELYRRVMERDTALKNEKAAVAAKLKEYGCEALDTLGEKLTQQQALEAQLAAQITIEGEAAAAHRKAREAALLIDKEFAQLRTLEKDRQSLAGQAAGYENTERRLALAAKTEPILPAHRALGEAKALLARRTTEEANAQGKVQDAKSTFSKAADMREKVEANREKYARIRELIALMESKRPIYTAIESLQKALNQAEHALADRAAAYKKAESEAALCTSALERAFRTQNEAIADQQHAQEQYRLGIGGELAQALETGKPCPVCGSLHHPAPAQPAAQRVTDAQLKALTDAVAQAGELANIAMQRRTNADAALANAQRLHQRAEQEAVAARRDHENALAQRIEGYDTLPALAAEIDRYQKSYDNYEAKARSCVRDYEAAQTALATAQAAQEAAQAELAAARQNADACAAAFAEALAGAGFESDMQFTAACLDPAERDRQRSALAQYRARVQDNAASLASQREKLAGQEAPDMKALDENLKQAEAAHKAAVAQHATAQELAARMKRDHASLTARTEAYAAARLETDADIEFAGRLRGRSGSSLQRYVLGVMLTSITVQANLLLRRVYGGRYQLHRTDAIAGSGRKGGLELEVYDAQNNERRSVTTLSGGEKFLVALSLAIGLSTVVQAQGSGIRLEAMFIDEGFGSLDRESVGDALEVLAGIQRTSGVVGIISHVEQLAETIPTKLEIVKSEKGSRIVERG